MEEDFMKTILAFLFLIGLMNVANATCTYSLDNDSLLFQGYTINFGDYLEKSISSKGYARVYDQANYEIIPHFDLKTEDHFEYAVAGFQLQDNQPQILTDISRQKRCYTQHCGVSDARKVLVEAINEFSKKIPVCRK